MRLMIELESHYYTDMADDYYGDDDGGCWQCGGDGYCIIGTDIDSDDYVNGPYVGDVIDCPCCGGSGRAEDCTYA
jgi:hypothetical protein